MPRGKTVGLTERGEEGEAGWPSQVSAPRTAATPGGRDAACSPSPELRSENYQGEKDGKLNKQQPTPNI